MDGQTAFDSKQYAIAADLLNEEYNKADNPLDKAEIAYQIADSYRYSNQPAKAADWYLKALEYSLDPVVPYKYALMLKQTEKYEEAIATLNKYAKENPLDRSRATRQIKSCQLAKEWSEKPSSYKIYSLDSINSKFSDYSPVIFNDEYLVFTSARSDNLEESKYGWTGEGYSNLYIASFKEDKNRFSSPQAFSKNINSAFNDGTVTFADNFNTMYFTRCVDEDFSENFCQIYFSERTNNDWSEAERIELFVDSVNIGQPFISPDGKQLFFSSDALEGYGEKDIYVSIKTNNEWGYPINLGPEVNTEGYEGFPYFHSDGTLYFASSGHLGMGGLDIFSAKPKSKNRYGEVKNLAYPINSGADDFGIVFSNFINPEEMETIEAKGFLSSSRSGGYGSDDVYAFTLEIEKEEEPEPEPIEPTIVNNPEPIVKPTIKPEPVVVDIPKGPVYILEGQIVTKVYLNPDDPKSMTDNTQPLPEAIAEVIGMDYTSTISNRIVTDEQGKFSIVLEAETDYRVSGTKPGYFNKSTTVSTKNKYGNDTTFVSVLLELDKIFANKEVTIDNIYYDLDKFDIRPDAAIILDGLAEVLFENPSIQIELGAHTDSRGSDRYNLDLSSKRAASAVTYLSSKGIDASRLSSRGYGETQLVNQCANGVDCSDEDHQQNRRTTFKVIQ